MIGFFWPTEPELVSDDAVKQTLIERMSKKSEVRVGSLMYKENSVDDIIRMTSAIQSPPGRTRRARGAI